MKRQHGRSGGAVDGDAPRMDHVFGTAVPNTIPESSAWWRVQQKELFAISGTCLSKNTLQDAVLATGRPLLPDRTLTSTGLFLKDGI